MKTSNGSSNQQVGGFLGGNTWGVFLASLGYPPKNNRRKSSGLKVGSFFCRCKYDFFCVQVI